MAALLLFLLFAIGASARAQDAPVYAAAGDVTGYQVGAQDVLEVAVFDEPDLSRTVTVDLDGGIHLPLVERVAVAGLTTAEIARRIEDRLREGQFLVHPHVTVRVTEFKSQQIEVVGGVARPGLYNLTGPTTLSEIVAQAGWIDAESANGQATVRRRDGTSTTVDLRALIKTGEGNFVLTAGDHVSLGEGEVVFVRDQVAKPGKYAFQRGLTVNQAVALAGDATQTARMAGAYVLRGDQKIRVNLKRIRKGRDPDVPLEPGDQVYVPESII
jgi:polysaccharide biosynthesis/export protein